MADIDRLVREAFPDVGVDVEAAKERGRLRLLELIERDMEEPSPSLSDPTSAS